MAMQYNVNVLIDGNVTREAGGGWLYELKEHLKTCGWVVAGSGDGLAAYSQDGNDAGSGGQWDVLTTHDTWNSGTPNSWSNPGAWFILRHPTSSIEFLFGRDTATTITDADDFVIAHSVVGYGTAGASASTLPNAAADEVFIRGSRATYYSIGINSEQQMFCHVGAEDADVNGVRPCYVVLTNRGTGTEHFWFIFDAMQIVGVENDAQPWVIGTYITATPTYMDDQFWCWDDYGLAGQVWRSAMGLFFRNAGTAMPPPSDGNTPILPAYYGYNNVTSGFWKGTAYLVRENFVTSRSYPSTVNILAASSRVHFGTHITLPWPQGVLPLL